ncbi:hypothetical protein BV20DRAFT_962858 [Pilatotrama ljubarskyi]|nr:hypothetical protein BV20DRAFT_962858 [Pilatotrama ljubarskyi]
MSSCYWRILIREQLQVITLGFVSTARVGCTHILPLSRSTSVARAIAPLVPDESPYRGSRPRSTDFAQAQGYDYCMSPMRSTGCSRRRPPSCRTRALLSGDLTTCLLMCLMAVLGRPPCNAGKPQGNLKAQEDEGPCAHIAPQSYLKSTCFSP